MLQEQSAVREIPVSLTTDHCVKLWIEFSNRIRSSHEIHVKKSGFPGLDDDESNFYRTLTKRLRIEATIVRITEEDAPKCCGRCAKSEHEGVTYIAHCRDCPVRLAELR